MRDVYECGYQAFGGFTERPCPSDPKFPRFEDYELKFYENPKESYYKWQCLAIPKTDMARRLSLSLGMGRTKEEAERFIRDRYNEYAKKRVG
jgi:hypothetical protein